MRTAFPPDRLGDPHIAAADANLRACVHCGICTASCPTYVLLGDERDSPRGRIVMIQKMLEEGGAPTAETVHHIDRCLSCLSCRSVCPSSVDYAQLVDTAHAHIETHFRRPLRERLLRWLIAWVMTSRARMRLAVALAKFTAPVSRRMPGRLGAMARMAQSVRAAKGERVVKAPVDSARKIAILPGCVQGAIAPGIDEAVARVLARRGIRAIPLQATGCCGALVHHFGRENDARDFARRLIEGVEAADRAHRFEAVLISATGCAAHLKQLAQLFVDDPVWRARAEAFSARLKDLSDIIEPLGGPAPAPLRLAYHQPCSQQHGLRKTGAGETLMRALGHAALAVPEGHLCCGSAGSYSILQPQIAEALRARKLENIRGLAPDAIVSTNIGCLHHLAGADAPPALHLAELIDWSEGGPVPQALAARENVAGTPGLR